MTVEGIENRQLLRGALAGVEAARAHAQHMDAADDLGCGDVAELVFVEATEQLDL